MGEWFLTFKGDPFITFGDSHIIMLILYIILLALLFTFRGKIREDNAVFQSIRWTLFTILILSEVLYQSWTATHGIWLYNLPFHLCGVAGLVGASALLTLNKKLMAITFFIALVPAFLALITPDLPYDFPNFRYLKFFIHHITISLTGFFMAITSKPGTITLKSLLVTYGSLVVYAIFTGFLLNPFLNANYLFLAHPPESATPLDWLGSGVWYRLNLGIICFIIFSLQYAGYRWFQRQFLS